MVMSRAGLLCFVIAALAAAPSFAQQTPSVASFDGKWVGGASPDSCSPGGSDAIATIKGRRLNGTVLAMEASTTFEATIADDGSFTGAYAGKRFHGEIEGNTLKAQYQLPTSNPPCFRTLILHRE
jgi:hypothetical protein